MFRAYGLKSHIWNNNLRSIFLLVFFPVLLLALALAFSLIWAGVTSDAAPDMGLAHALNALPAVAPAVLGVSGAWFAVAFLGHQKMIEMATKSESVTKSQAPRLYKMLETLCISRGITVPKLSIIQTDAMNAFASGVRDKNYTITLTTGLINNLDDEELEAVIAHELSHIKNRDVRLLIIAVIFVGIFAFVGEGVFRGLMRTNLPRNDHHRRSRGSQAGALVIFGLIIIAISYFFALMTRFALSRKREYMADAAAVELTKNPDAMIRVLKKISGQAELKNVPAEIREMAFENPRTGFSGMFATHPPIEKRIEALVKFAGGRENTQSRYRRERSTNETPEAKGKNGRIGRNPWWPR